MQSSHSRGHLALVLVLGLIWGLNWPIVKVALGEYGPWTLRAVSLGLATVLLVIMTLARGGSLRIRAAEWWRVVLPGFVAIAAVNILNAFAQLHMATGRTAIVAFSMPIWATLMARVFLGELIDRRKAVGMGLGIAGLVALGWPVIRSGTFSLGLLLGFLSALCWASGVVFMKRFPVRATPIAAATWQLAVGALVLIAGMVIFERPDPGSFAVTPALAALAYNTVLAQGVGMWLWFEVLGRTSTGIAAIGTLIVPAIGVLGSLVILGEHPLPTDWIGLVLVSAASASVLLVPRRRI